jgi:hypothetical protein
MNKSGDRMLIILYLIGSREIIMIIAGISPRGYQKINHGVIDAGVGRVLVIIHFLISYNI